MLYMLGVIIWIIFTIMCFSSGLKEAKNAVQRFNNSKKNDLSKEDFHLLAKILSVGLVDADPDYLHHLKEYRDLHGGSL